LPAFLRGPAFGLRCGADFRVAMGRNLPGLGSAVKANVRKCAFPLPKFCPSSSYHGDPPGKSFRAAAGLARAAPRRGRSAACRSVRRAGAGAAADREQRSAGCSQSDGRLVHRPHLHAGPRCCGRGAMAGPRLRHAAGRSGDGRAAARCPGVRRPALLARFAGGVDCLVGHAVCGTALPGGGAGRAMAPRALRLQGRDRRSREQLLAAAPGRRSLGRCSASSMALAARASRP
jgi:hypothetical protein